MVRIRATATTLVAVTLAALAVVVGAGTAAQAQGVSKIAFTREVVVSKVTTTHIFTMTASGTSQVDVTPGSVRCNYARWTPGGKIIHERRAFRNALGTSAVWTMNANGSGAQRVTADCYRINSLSVSPDGGLVAFDVEGQPWTVHVARTDGTQDTTVKVGAASERLTACNWSPDLSTTAGYQGYLLIGHDNAVPTTLGAVWLDSGALETPASETPVLDGVTARLEWSPDGLRLAYVGAGGTVLRAIDVPWENGLPVFPLAPAAAYDIVAQGSTYQAVPHWNPADGTQMVFTKYAPSGGYDIHRATVVPGVPSTSRLTTNKAWEGNPDWSLPLL